MRVVMCTSNYRAHRMGDLVIIRASDNDAKQVFFGWGSDKNAIDGSFYGRGTRVGVGDHEVWEWKLTEDGVAKMISIIEKYGRNIDFYETARERDVAQELLTLLRGMRRA